MKTLILILCLLATSSMAQVPPPEQAAMGAEIMECVGGKVQLRTRINQLEAELAKLKTPPPEEKKP